VTSTISRTVKAPVKSAAINTMKMGAKSKINKRGYDSEMLWVGTSEGKVTRTIQYPVTSRWAKELDKISGVSKVLYYLHASMQWTQVAVRGNQEFDSRIEMPVSTMLYIPLHQGL
jgi:hypothetical protein